MRFLNLLRNTFYAICSGIVAGILAFAVRKAFVSYLPVELLGLEGFLVNVLNMLSLAEIGISTVISYGLYRELANKNQQEINMLMNIYRYVYFVFGIFVFLAGVVIFFTLPFIVHDKSVPWGYVQFVYCIQLGIVLSSYFLAYKRTLFTADQKDYKCIRIDTVCTTVNNICKLFAIIFVQSYVLYAISSLAFNIFANLLIAREIKKDYPFLHYVRITFSEMRKREFLKDVKNFFVHKVSYIVYGSTDAIVVSSILGLRMSGLLANYVLIEQSVYKVIYKILQGIIPTVGNLVYDDDRDKVLRIYMTLDFFYYLLGTYISCLYIVALQPFICLFFGNELLLPDAYVFALAVNMLLSVQFENAYNFRSTHGCYEYDRKYMMASAIANIVVSVVLVYKLGIVGIMIGTIFGFLFIGYGRVKFVFDNILHISKKDYLLNHLKKTMLSILEIMVISSVVKYVDLPITYINIVLNCVMSTLLMLALQYAIFRNDDNWKDVLSYVGNIKNIIKELKL